MSNLFQLNLTEVDLLVCFRRLPCCRTQMHLSLRSQSDNIPLFLIFWVTEWRNYGSAVSFAPDITGHMPSKRFSFCSSQVFSIGLSLWIKTRLHSTVCFDHLKMLRGMCFISEMLTMKGVNMVNWLTGWNQLFSIVVFMCHLIVILV